MQGDGHSSAELRQYALITASYWAFTLTDGALRMLVVLYFHQLGYSPLEIALLFVFYEVFGIITNLTGGWLGARFGLNRTMHLGLLLQIGALSLLLVPPHMLTLVWVMAAQAVSGVAKDLNKMSAKSAVKLLLPDDAQSTLFKWVALLTGSKNTLKGVGFFLGGVLLSVFGFQGAVMIMASALLLVLLLGLVFIRGDLGRSKSKPKFRAIFSKSSTINYLSAARLFLFGARDVWFVVALPVFLAAQFGWSHSFVGGFLASWVILYGVAQATAPKLIFNRDDAAPGGRSAQGWALLLSVIPLSIAGAMQLAVSPMPIIVIGLLVFGLVFAINSALHSYLIVRFASRDDVSLDVGFYYMANASGRLLGTILSGYVYQAYGLEACLVISGVFVLIAALLSYKIPNH